MTTWFRYPRKVISDTAGPAGVAIAAPVLPVLVIDLILFMIGEPPQHYDFGRLSTGLTVFLALGWVVLMVATVPQGYARLQRFSLRDDGIARRVFGVESVIPWENVTSVEIRARPKFEIRGWTEETFVLVRAGRKSFAFYDQLDDYAEFKDSVSAICRRLSIPQFSLDRRWATLEALKKENPDLHRKSKRRGLRKEVDHL